MEGGRGKDQNKGKEIADGAKIQRTRTFMNITNLQPQDDMETCKKVRTDLMSITPTVDTTLQACQEQ